MPTPVTTTPATGNAGSHNGGSHNAGDDNVGDWNTGSRNLGNYNADNRNTGNANAGDWNTGSGCAGCFNTAPAALMFFDRPASITMEEWRQSAAYKIMGEIPLLEMERQDWWEDLTDEQRDAIRAIPNFCPEKFKKLTGIDAG